MIYQAPPSLHFNRIRTQSAPTLVAAANLNGDDSQMLRGFAAHAHLDLSGRVLQESQHPCGQGAYCDVYKGLSLVHAKYVAIKRFREYVYGGLSDKFAKSLASELEIWAKLRHPNVLPLLGYIADDTRYPALISQWMPNGTVLQYCMTHPAACILNLAKGMAAGLFYLHSKGVVHSDMKSDNVLVTASGVPQLADFGVSRLFVQTGTVDSSSNLKGSVRWTSVELLRDEAQTQKSVTESKETRRLISLQADVWAFGMTVYEILTKDRPYYHLPTDFQVFFAIISGKLPVVPARIEQEIAETDEKALWVLCKKCWSTKPEDRPTMMDVTFELSSGCRTMNQSREGSRARQESSEVQLSDLRGNSEPVGKKPSDRLMLPRTSKKARVLNNDVEVNARRQEQGELFIKHPVQPHPSNTEAKQSLLSLRMRQEALTRAHPPRELTAQQRISVADVFAPTAADWAWRKGTRKSSLAAPVATVTSMINFDVQSNRAGSPNGDESESGQAAAAQRSSRSSATNSLRPSSTSETKPSNMSHTGKKEVDLSSQGAAFKALAALYDWVKLRPRVAEADVKDVQRRPEPRLLPAREHDIETGGSTGSVLVAQQLDLPPAIAAAPARKVTGFAAEGLLAEGSLPIEISIHKDRRWRWTKNDTSVCKW